MGIRINELLSFTVNIKNIMKNVATDEKGQIEELVLELYAILNTIEEAKVDFLNEKKGSIEKFESQEIGQYLNHDQLGQAVRDVKYLCDLTQRYIKVGNKFYKRIDECYQLFFPEQSDAHIQMIKYVQHSNLQKEDLYHDLKRMKDTGEVLFDFEQLNYADLNLIWYRRGLTDKHIQDLFNVPTLSQVYSKRKKMHMEYGRMKKEYS